MSDERVEATAALPGELAPVVLTFSGVLSLQNVSQFERELPEAAPFSRVVLDFSDVTSVDSTIISAMMRFRRRYEKAGGNAVDIVVLAQEPIYRLFEITGVTRAFTVLPAERRSAGA